MGKESQEEVRTRKVQKNKSEIKSDKGKNPARDLYTAVLHRAVADLDLDLDTYFSTLHNPIPIASAVEFFKLDEPNVQGSFVWICNQLDLCPHLILKCLQERLKNAKIRLETYLIKFKNTIH